MQKTEENPKHRLLDDIGRICPELKPEIEKLQPPRKGPYDPAELSAWLCSSTWIVFRIAMGLGRRVLQERLDDLEGLDRPREDSAGDPRVCPCPKCGSRVWRYNGGKARCRTLRSIFGPVVLRRYQSKCSRCRSVFYPLDTILGLSSRVKMLPALQEIVSFVGTRLHFRDASAVLNKAIGVRLSAEIIRKAVGVVGEAVAKRIDQADWEPEIQLLKEATKDTEGPCIVELALDGAMVPMNKKPKSEPNSHQEARSMSLRVKDKKGKLRARLIISRLVPLPRFLVSVSSLVDECRETLGLKNIVLTGDGAKWIWQFAERCSLSRTVLDWYHLRKYVTAFVEASEGGKSHGRRKRLDRIEDALWNGRIDQALEELRGYRCRNNGERTARGDLERYIKNNRAHIINYDWNWSRGKIVGSGAIEGGQQKSIHDRMKCSGMRWSERGADRMMAARSAELNGTARSDIRTANRAA